LPFPPASFDLVTSRHPVDTPWPEIGRVLQRGGTLLSQQVGPRSVAELSEYLMGPQRDTGRRDPERHRALAEAAGLRVDDLRTARLRMTFDDIGAVVYFLRLVIWIVPGFSTERYRARLHDLHDEIERDGPFVAHSTRFLIEARRPG
jgi:SAM-dependent methyltransferase